MRLPWHNRTGLAQPAAFLAAILTISLGLCGANFAAFARWGNYETAHAPWWPSSFLIFAGIAEVIAILVSFAALIIVCFMMLFQWIEARLSAGNDRKGKL